MTTATRWMKVFSVAFPWVVGNAFGLGHHYAAGAFFMSMCAVSAVIWGRDL